MHRNGGKGRENVMVIAFVLFGAVAGFVAAVIALTNGASVWIALLAYSGVGVASVLVGIALIVLSRQLRDPELRGAPPLGVQSD